MRIIVLGKKLRKKLWKNKKKLLGVFPQVKNLDSRLVSKEISLQNKSCLEKALALLPLVFGVLGVLGVLGDPLVLEYEL